jgi:hypothetical protein
VVSEPLQKISAKDMIPAIYAPNTKVDQADWIFHLEEVLAKAIAQTFSHVKSEPASK